jgi:hypothetical protein
VSPASRGRKRPFRATVYLPGHDENGHGVVAAKVSATTQANLDRALEGYLVDGYAITRYEVLELPLASPGGPGDG